jgi:hypothetical protein
VIGVTGPPAVSPVERVRRNASVDVTTLVPNMEDAPVGAMNSRGNPARSGTAKVRSILTWM